MKESDGNYEWLRAVTREADGFYEWDLGAKRMYFIDNAARIARAFDFQGNRLVANDIALGAPTGFWAGGMPSPTRVFFVDTQTGRPRYLRAFDHSGNRITADDVNLGPASVLLRGGTAFGNRMYYLLGTRMIALDFARNRQSGDDFSTGVSGNHQGVIATETRLFVVSGRNITSIRTHDGRTVSGENDINLPRGSRTATPTGGAATPDLVFIVDNANDIARAYTHSRVRSSSDDINLGSGSWQGGFSIGYPELTP